MLLVLLCAYMTIMTSNPWYNLSDSTFLQPNNVENLLRRTSMYGILGIGVAFVIISGGIDLSVGSVVCLSGCLLAIFLQVDYRAFDHLSVLHASSSRRAFVVAGQPEQIAPGDQIRFSGGRRARSGVFTVQRTESSDWTAADFESAGIRSSGGVPGPLSVTSIFVAEPISNDDRSGEIARAFEIKSITSGEENGGSTSIELAGQHTDLSARDQLALVHPLSGLKQWTIASTTLTEDRTIVTLANKISNDVSTEWSGVPLERRQRLSIPAAILSVIAIAFALGCLHGLLVTRGRLQPFVVTLCGLLIYRGVSRWLVSDQPVGFGSEFEANLSPLGAGKWQLFEWEVDGRLATFGLPYPLFILIVVAVLASLFLNKTIWGRYLLALGRNEEAARYSGINTAQMTLVAYVVSTTLAAVGGILFALDSNSISPSSFGNFFELYAIAAAVLGGCSLRGGEGSVLGVLAGTAVMQILYNLIILMKISGTLEFAIIGAVILFGVVADEMVKRVAAGRRARSPGK